MKASHGPLDEILNRAFAALCPFAMAAFPALPGACVRLWTMQPGVLPVTAYPCLTVSRTSYISQLTILGTSVTIQYEFQLPTSFYFECGKQSPFRCTQAQWWVHDNGPHKSLKHGDVSVRRTSHQAGISHHHVQEAVTTKMGHQTRVVKESHHMPQSSDSIVV